MCVGIVLCLCIRVFACFDGFGFADLCVRMHMCFGFADLVFMCVLFLRVCMFVCLCVCVFVFLCVCVFVRNVLCACVLCKRGCVVAFVVVVIV